MKKSLFWTSIAASLIAVINLITYTSLACTKVVDMRVLSYMFLLGYLVCSWLPFFVHILFKVKINMTISICYQIFLILSLIVGSLWKVYGMWALYDSVIHLGSGVLIALIGYMFFINSGKNKTSLLWIFIISLSISMLCGGIWEIWEFTTDGIIGNNSQIFEGLVGREALMDTMIDIICDFVGGIIGGVVAVSLEHLKRKKISVEQ